MKPSTLTRLTMAIGVLLLFLFLLSPGPLFSQLLMDQVDVYAVDTSKKQSVFLAAGKKYDFVCSGTFSFWRNALGDSAGLVDAAYYRVVPPPELGFPGLQTSSSNGFLLDGQPIASRAQPAGMSPTYTYSVPYTGQGAAASLFIEDRPPLSVDRHSDNSGMIRVTIYNVSPEIIFAPASVDFGEVELGQFRDTIINIRNIGYGPLQLTDMEITGPDASHYQLISAASQTILPGDSTGVQVRFRPSSIFRKDAVLRIPCNDSDTPDITIPLTGVGVTTLTAGFTSAYHAQPEQHISIPVTLFDNIAGSNTTSFRFKVYYDYRILWPQSVSSRGTLSNSFTVSSSLISPGILHIEGTNGQPLTGTGNLVDIDFLVVLDNVASSPLVIDSLQFNSGNPRARMVNGLFTLDSLCNQYLKRVVQVGTVRLLPNRPNPFHPRTQIEYSLPLAGNVRLEVFSRLGSPIQILVDSYQNAGPHLVEFDGGSLPDGLYYYTLTTPQDRLTKQMLLLR